MPKKMKGTKFDLVQTEGLTPDAYPLFNLMGLSAGKLLCIVDALKNHDTVLSKEILGMIHSKEII